MNKETRKEFLLLKEQLKEVERGILLDGQKYDVLIPRLQERLLILNQIFSIHATDNEVQRLIEVNDKLHRQGKDYHERAEYIHASFKELHDAKGEPMLIETELVPNLRHTLQCELRVMEEDTDYGSQWHEIISVIGKVSQVRGLSEIIIQDIISMNIGALKYIQQMDDLCVSELFWQLTDKFYLSVPDILKIQYYYYRYSRYWKSAE